MKKVDPFAQAPEFLAAFNNVVANGFFAEIKFSVGDKMFEGDVHFCSINACGYIPNNKKYFKKGCGTLIDPQAIIASCKAITGRHKVKQVTVTVETSDWWLTGKAGERMEGSKGTRTVMYIGIQFAA